MKKYAKNPAELVIQNPTKKKKMAKRKRDSKGRFKKNRNNPIGGADEFVDTGKNLFMQYGLAALASTGTVKGAQYLIGKVPNIPSWAKEWGMIAGPAVAGIVLSMYADRNSALTQGLAGGMVLASANELSDKLLKGNSKAEMSDANISKGDLIVKPDGYLYDQQGNRLARIADGQESQANTPALPAFESRTNNGGGHMLGDAGFDDFSGSFEQGEAFAA
jgi:hypothetical protein